MPNKQESLDRIAAKLWGYPLKDRGFDRLDFHDGSARIAEIYNALVRWYS